MKKIIYAIKKRVHREITGPKNWQKWLFNFSWGYNECFPKILKIESCGPRLSYLRLEINRPRIILKKSTISFHFSRRWFGFRFKYRNYLE